MHPSKRRSQTHRSRLGPITLVVVGLSVSLACRGNSTEPSGAPPARTFLMGFSNVPPDSTLASALASLDAWTRRADAAIFHTSVPYRALLGGMSATTYVDSVHMPVVNYYRARGLTIVVTVDVTNGLDRSAEDPDLVAMGRSITEPAVQQVYRDYVKALAQRIQPAYLGLAAETNLIRGAATAAVYTAVVQMSNAAAADVRALPPPRPLLYASVQADEGWGRLLHNNVYQGVETDFHDFPFMEALALSSYPYFVFADPNDIPLDYYTRLANGRSLPVLVVEGGWTSGAVGSVQSSPTTQARYLRKQEQLLDAAKAVAVFQLTYADLDLSQFPPQPAGSILPLFAQLGVVSSTLAPKPALLTYDSIFARRLAQK
jgi:hypothetical protein